MPDVGVGEQQPLGWCRAARPGGSRRLDALRQGPRLPHPAGGAGPAGDHGERQAATVGPGPGPGPSPDSGPGLGRGPGDGGGGVLAVVVDQHDRCLPGVLLSEQGRQGGGQHGLFVPRRDHHGDRGPACPGRCLSRCRSRASGRRIDVVQNQPRPTSRYTQAAATSQAAASHPDTINPGQANPALTLP